MDNYAKVWNSPKLVQMIQTLCENFQRSVDRINGNETTDWFPMTTGLKQGCCRLGFLFLQITDCVMSQTVEGERTGIDGTSQRLLEDLDFADDVAFLSSTMNHLQSKTTISW